MVSDSSFIGEYLATTSDILVAASISFTVLAFLIRDILWLRSLAILGNLFMAISDVTHDPLPVINFFGHLLIVAINIGHSFYLIMERRRAVLKPREQALREQALGSMDAVTAKRLFLLGQWVWIDEGTTLITQGQKPDRLYALLEGKAFAAARYRKVGELGPGQFVGEMSFLTNDTAGATVVTSERCLCFEWDRELLRQQMDRSKDLNAAVVAALGGDMARKIMSQNMRFVRKQLPARG
ncbi:cyclic nucleotide-binding domain-containing protein [Kiloniella sp. b19]|uniref:cyclic nucleotide-binding domain-containing protein n=1 Tax=Kiloniella sp. GXU_MW_B19 TaxID=3141326 RepID=UPI0031D8173D